MNTTTELQTQIDQLLQNPTPDPKALAYRKLGDEYDKIGSLQPAVTAYEQAIEYAKQLSLETDENRKIVANVYNLYGAILCDKIRTTDALHKAVDSFNQVIQLREQLPLENNENLHALAQYGYFNRGNAQRAFNNPDNLKAAIESYNQAIRIGETLPKDNLQFQNDLAGAYNNRGLAQANLGGTNNLTGAIESYEQAIRIRETLPKDNPEFQNDVANTYMNRGLAQKNLGGQDNLKAAIESYNQAIRIGETLPKDKPLFQNDLVKAYWGYGLTQKNLGGLDNSKSELESYNKAIRIGETLPKDNPEFQNDLAGVYNNYGFAQQTLGGPNNLKAAIESYNQALSLVEKFDQRVRQFIKVRAKLLGNLASAYFKLSEWDKANDAAEQGLDLLRELEINSTYVLRSLREELFEFTIDTYLASAYNFLPEFLLEHLDPENEGAAPQSEAMHEAALRGLQQLYLIAYQQHPELIPEIMDTLIQLAQIRGLYFVGTANGAKLTAQYFEENAQDRQQAERILTDYIQQRPTDIEGYMNLAAFYQRQQQTDKAVQTYETALQTFANTLPKRPDEKTLQQTLNTALRCVDLAAEVKFGRAFIEPAATEAARQQMNQRYNEANRWLGALPFGLPDFLHNLVKVQIETNLVPRFEQIQNHWLQQQDQQQFKQWRAQEQARQAQKQQLLLQAVRLLPKNERQFIEAILSLNTIIDDYLEKWQAAETEEAKADIEAQISEILTRRMQEFIEQLHESAFSEAMQKVESALSDVWSALDSEDRKWLATAWHCLEAQGLQTFAGLNLGIAIEKNLLQRWIYPVREQAQEQQIQFTIEDEENSYQTQLVEFLNHPNKHLTLGVLVKFLNQLAHSSKGPSCKAEQSLFDYLSQQPNVDQLLNQPKNVTKIRNKALYKILDIRNRVAHPKNPPTRPQLEQMLKDVVTDPQHAFFRYFVGIFITQS
jgi:tetratricopeptide (TPR) repeat protein